ncbi:FAD-dependent oxidoreductase, partial [bacterium]|nr:FAD-dependent oxidoreductase [bacterium]
DFIVNSKIKMVEEKEGKFLVRVLKNPLFVDNRKCIVCGECSKVCPAGENVVFLSNPQASPLSYHIEVSKCLHFKGEDCTKCESVCPNGAITLDERPEEMSFTVDLIIVAIGFRPVDAAKKYNYHLNSFQNVITGYDLEKMIRDTGGIFKPSDGSLPKEIAFIQCVGSRDSAQGMDYCSRVCCMYSMRIARMLKFLYPELRITFFYMDLQNFGKNFSEFYKESMDRMKFIRGIPAKIDEDENSTLILRYEDVTKNKIEEKSFDMVALSIGMQPSEDTNEIAGLLEIPLEENGFFKSLDFIETASTFRKGIFIAGACQGPKDINESLSNGINAAKDVLEYLNSKITLVR